MILVTETIGLGCPSSSLLSLSLSPTQVGVYRLMGKVHELAQDGDEEALEDFLRLKDKSEVDIQDKMGRAPLHYTAMEGHIEAAHLLISKGANLRLQDSNNWTALHFAAHYGHAEVVALLLEQGAWKTAVTSAGRTAADVAKNAHIRSLIELGPRAVPVRPPPKASPVKGKKHKSRKLDSDEYEQSSSSESEDAGDGDFSPHRSPRKGSPAKKRGR